MPGKMGGAAFRWSVPVRFGDTDPYGVVHFVSYFRVMKEALDEFLRAGGLPPERTYRDVEAGRGLPVAASSARFLTPARYGDTLDIQVTVGTCSEKSVRFDFHIGRRPGGEPVATGDITCVAIDASWHSIALPPEWRDRLLEASK
jgi:YbgC/YbaW family acyl-CoA thioester hydrolase